MEHADRFLRRFYIEKGMFGSLSLTFIFYRPPLFFFFLLSGFSSVFFPLFLSLFFSLSHGGLETMLCFLLTLLLAGS